MLHGTAVNPGDINVEVIATDKAGATVSDEYKLTVKRITGFEEFGENETVKIYPNPTKGHLIIETETFEAGTKVHCQRLSWQNDA